jgi:hypothetical protein
MRKDFLSHSVLGGSRLSRDTLTVKRCRDGEIALRWIGGSANLGDYDLATV